MGAIEHQLERSDFQPKHEEDNRLFVKSGTDHVISEKQPNTRESTPTAIDKRVVDIAAEALERATRPEAQKTQEETSNIVDTEFEFIAQAERPELLVENPAYSEMAAYETVEDFEKNINNFLMFFQDGLGEYYRDKPCWGRFEMLHEELAESLRNALANYQGDFYSLSPKQKNQVFKAYGKMAELVDKTDPYVCDQHGHVDEIYLNR